MAALGIGSAWRGANCGGMVTLVLVSDAVMPDWLEPKAGEAEGGAQKLPAREADLVEFVRGVIERLEVLLGLWPAVRPDYARLFGDLIRGPAG